MRSCARPLGTDPGIVSGESGAVSCGLPRCIPESEKLRELFRIDRNPVILLISTEGGTDPAGYAKIIGGTD